MKRSYWTTDDDWFSADGARQWSGGVVLTVPLGSVSTRAGVSKARLELRRARTQVRRLELTIVLEVRDAIRNLRSSLEGIGAAERSRVAAEDPKSKAENKATFSGKIFKIIYSNTSEGKLLRALMTELQNIVTVDLAILMSPVKNNPGVFKIEDLVVDGSTSIRKGAVYSFQDPRVTEVVTLRHPLILNVNGSASSDIEKQLFESHGINSCLCVPILTGDTVSRLLVLGAKRTANFSEAGGYADWIAGGLSMAMERNRLSSTVAKQKQALSAAHQIGLALVSRNYDTEKVLSRSMEHIRKIMNVEAGTLYLKEKDQLKITTAFNTQIDTLKKYRLKIGQGVAGYVAAKGKTMVETIPENHLNFSSRSIS